VIPNKIPIVIRNIKVYLSVLDLTDTVILRRD